MARFGMNDGADSGPVEWVTAWNEAGDTMARYRVTRMSDGTVRVQTAGQAPTRVEVDGSTMTVISGPRIPLSVFLAVERAAA